MQSYSFQAIHLLIFVVVELFVNDRLRFSYILSTSCAACSPTDTVCPAPCKWWLDKYFPNL